MRDGNGAQVARRRQSAEALRLADGADDGFGQRVGRERADDVGVDVAGPAAGGQREHGVAIAEGV